MSAQHAPVADDLTARLRAIAYGTTFLDVRADILALIERDDRNRMDGIAACELLAVSRARCAVLLEALTELERWVTDDSFQPNAAQRAQGRRALIAAREAIAKAKAISLATGESK